MTTAAATYDPIAELWREARAWLAEAMRDLRGPAAVAHVIAGKIRAAIKRQIARLELLLTKLLLIEAARVMLSHPFPDARKARSPGLRRAEAASAAQAGPMNTAAASKPAQAAACHRQAPAIMDPGLGAARQSGNGWEDPANPETWRVRFCLRIPREHPRAAGGPRISDLGPPLLVRDIWRDNKRRALIDRLRRAIPANAQSKARDLARRFEALRRVLAGPRRAIVALARKLQSLGQRARAFARRIAFARAPRAKPSRATFVNALVHAHYASLKLPSDTS